MKEIFRRRRVLACALAIGGCSLGVFRARVWADDDGAGKSWLQWGRNAQHTGAIDVEGQPLDRIVADITYDPLVPDEQAFTGGELLAHYQVPLLDGNDVFMAFKTGKFDPKAANPFSTEIFHQKRLHWQDDQLVEKWDFQTDWTPEPADYVGGWEPVYHAVFSNDHLFDMGAGGTLFKLSRGSGEVEARINPFGSIIDPNTFVAGPPTADQNGNIYYNVLKLDPNAPNPFTGASETAVDSWLVKVDQDGNTSKVSYIDLVPDAPSTCIGRFSNSQLPWPPSPTATPSTMFPCGIARVGVNVSPAVAPDGTIYTVARVENSPRYGWVVAVNPDLTLKWDTSLRNLFLDGCGVTIPIAPSATPAKGTCRFGAVTSTNFGVDPTTNRPGDGNVIDQSSSSPTVLPDGNVLYGSYSRYNIARGHLIKFNAADGSVMAYFDFGWDSTPAVFAHDDGDRDDDGSVRYSIVIKDNHYDEESGFYCNPSGGVSDVVCASTGIPAGPFYITQLNKNLVPEWKFHNIETNSCTRNPDGTLTCISDHPNGFEWCINAPAVDGNHAVYAESEDGNAYRIPQGHTGIFDLNSAGAPASRIFQRLALGAAYTPLSIDRQGKIYTQNGGHLFVIDGGQ